MTAVMTRPRSADPRLTRPAIRLRPAPPLEPPFDDEMAPHAWAIPDVDQLALDWSGTPADPASPRTELVPPVAATAGASAESRTAARRFAATCVEIFNGYRPVGHVRRLSSPQEAMAVVEQLGRARAKLAEQPTRGGPGPRTAARRGARPDPVRIGRVRVCEPRPGIAEVAAVLSSTRRAWALAFRLERRRGAWLCTTAEVL